MLITLYKRSYVEAVVFGKTFSLYIKSVCRLYLVSCFANMMTFSALL